MSGNGFADMKPGDKTRLPPINAGFIIGLIAIVVTDFSGRLLQKPNPSEEWASIFSNDVIPGCLPEFIFLGVIAIVVAVITTGDR